MNFLQKRGMFSIAKESFPRGFVLGTVVAFVGVACVFIAQERFRASADFMVSSVNEHQDYYTATRSAEYMSRVLGEILYSESFINAVVDTGRIGTDFLPRDKKDRLKQWSKMLDVKKNSELGFIRVSLAGANEREVSKVSNAVIEVLDTKSGELFGDSGEKVDVRLLSGPIIERTPSGSTLSAILLLGLLFGIFLNFVWQLMKEELRFDTRK